MERKKIRRNMGETKNEEEMKGKEKNEKRRVADR